MKKNYLLFLLFLPTLFYGQITLENGTVPDLSAYFGDNSENIAGTGEYQIFLDTVDGVLDKPIIVIDGFDPGDGRSITGLYDLLGYTDMNGPQNLADFVRTQGFDVIILNFPVYTRADMTEIDGGADFIERNAMLLVDLITTINTDKIGDEELVVIGPSMGGIISKYALNHMEANMQDHETRLWLSFDSPHLGANVPIGLQHQLNYLAYGLDLGGFIGNQNIVEIQPLIDSFLKSPAARQLLTDHFEAHLLGGSDFEFDPAKLDPESHPWRTTFLTNSLATSFPQDTRNISMINGSGNGNSYFAMGTSGTLVSPGFDVIDTSFSLFGGLATAFIDVKFTPSSNNTGALVSSLLIEPLFGAPLVDATADSATSNFDGVDAAPGGLFDLAGLTGDLMPDPGSTTEMFLNALQIDKFNFIPSVSGMALEVTNNEPNWFHTFMLPDNSDTINNTPFDAWFIPTLNEPHVQLTEANVAWALDEIILETLSSPSNDLSVFKIERNPIKDELLILSNQSFDNSKITITDLTGKIVLQEATTLNSRTTIPVNIASGMYVLNIEAGNQLFQTKIIVQ